MTPAPSPPHENAHRPAGPVLVTGGTGTLGRPLVDRLLADGLPVRVMSRKPRREGDERPCEWAVCDLVKGTGVTEAVSGVRAPRESATAPS
ncbi:SDR family oxidoreductase [Streptomyces reniochalinae]|uniref:NAD-dependent epimerase/dehydratase family protein n=1 Tax=Streptomyces reniochalinae TaxID=2250578 RepID=A0A367E6E0_9ACTN|nr:NAD-dependent epimerase/dehydratase family protein [Streptomyces reniochalinae]RCG13571.1 NAD-dependent epimerase/dehydratase family protein [Streptomyces reniochalinae]